MGVKNFRKIPEHIRLKLNSIDIDQGVRVGAAINLSKTSISDEKWKRTGLYLKNGVVQTKSSSFMPSKDVGKYCRRNIDGFERIRKDWPKVNKTINLGNRPIWGDWSNGSFPLSYNRKVYAREKTGAQKLTVRISTHEESSEEVVVLYELEHALNPKRNSFETELLFQLNILQELIGHVDIYPSSIQPEEYLRSLHVEWELLPPGTRESAIKNEVLKSYRKITPELKNRLNERLEFMNSLESDQKELIIGTQSFKGYFGLKLDHDLVLLESIKYGHAMYIMFDNWQQLSQMSRTELLDRSDGSFIRIPHIKGWQIKAKKIVHRKKLENFKRDAA